ncbi:MAG: efflux RND transporter periplasmic adaptor subunit [Betaproteobacteria bacterium]|nr:MAG: efflux RND transporter periplasmic adaptor subunit [Betaproteobacteria bacterium]
MKRLLLLPIIALVLAACTPGGAQEKKAADARGGPPAAVPVTAIAVAPRAVPVSFEAVGRTEGSREVQVRARVAGIVEQQLYNEGDTVKAGAPLFRIERAPYEIELAQARASLAQEVARRDLAQQEYERLKGLADRRAISQKEADQAASQQRQSVAAVQMAQARVRQAELNLSYTEVNAPIAGITGRALQSIGTLVQPNNDSALLTTLTRGDPIWVRFGLSEAEYSRLRGSKGIEVKVELADGSAYPQAGKVNFAGSTVDAATGTVQMRAELPNAKLALLPGQYVRVQVIAGTQQAIVVPQTAVMQNEGGRYVWIIENQKAIQRQIRAGNWLGADWVVLDGLKAGDQVIIDNLVRLRPGAPVQVRKAG